MLDATLAAKAVLWWLLERCLWGKAKQHIQPSVYMYIAILHSLVPRPPLAAFFAVMEKHTFFQIPFFHSCEKSCDVLTALAESIILG